MLGSCAARCVSRRALGRACDVWAWRPALIRERPELRTARASLLTQAREDGQPGSGRGLRGKPRRPRTGHGGTDTRAAEMRAAIARGAAALPADIQFQRFRCLRADVPTLFMRFSLRAPEPIRAYPKKCQGPPATSSPTAPGRNSIDQKRDHVSLPFTTRRPPRVRLGRASTAGRGSAARCTGATLERRGGGGGSGGRCPSNFARASTTRKGTPASFRVSFGVSEAGGSDRGGGSSAAAAATQHGVPPAAMRAVRAEARQRAKV